LTYLDIRRDIESLDIEHEFYPNASDVSLGTSLEKMPSTLTKFLAWLIDDKSAAIASAIVRIELNTILDIP
jgi:hypothetical protein